MARLPGAPAHGRLPTPPDFSAASRCPAYKYPYAACWPPRPTRCLTRHSCTLSSSGSHSPRQRLAASAVSVQAISRLLSFILKLSLAHASYRAARVIKGHSADFLLLATVALPGSVALVCVGVHSPRASF
eukprot:2529443-Pleurochrysis_carterae.AAC.1